MVAVSSLHADPTSSGLAWFESLVAIVAVRWWCWVCIHHVNLVNHSMGFIGLISIKYCYWWSYCYCENYAYCMIATWLGQSGGGFADVDNTAKDARVKRLSKIRHRDAWFTCHHHVHSESAFVDTLLIAETKFCTLVCHVMVSIGITNCPLSGRSLGHITFLNFGKWAITSRKRCKIET